MAARDSVQEATWLRYFMNNLGYGDLSVTNFGSLCDRDFVKARLSGFMHKGELPITIFEDNKGTIALSQNSVLHKRSRHIHVRYHFVRNQVNLSHVELVYIPTTENIADIMTKCLTLKTHMYLCSKMLTVRGENGALDITGKPIVVTSKSIVDEVDFNLIPSVQKIWIDAMKMAKDDAVALIIPQAVTHRSQPATAAKAFSLTTGMEVIAKMLRTRQRKYLVSQVTTFLTQHMPQSIAAG